MDVATAVLDKIDAITRDSVEVVITVSSTEEALPEGIKKYLNA